MDNYTVNQGYDPILDAVNACLAGIGEAPVDNIDDGNLDVDMAVNTVLRVSRQMQSKGWWFNKEDNWVLAPNDVNGIIAQPVNTLSVINGEKDPYRKMTIRAGKIYDMQRHTFDLRGSTNKKGNITFTFVVYLEFQDCPPIFQTAVSEIAKRVFAQDLEVDQTRWTFQKKDEDRALALLDVENGRNNKRNYIRDNPTMKQVLGGMFSPKPF